MKVLITGGTGFVGAHSAVAAQRAGHEIRLLVRDPVKAARVASAVGLVADDLAVGDITDDASVQKALIGCDGVLHTAAAVSLERRHAAETMAVNMNGTRNVLRAAVDRGLERIVHVSSTSALDMSGATLTVNTPVATSGSYAAAKAAAEQTARELQQQGAPVHITYPSGIIGPAAGESLGESSVAMARFIGAGIMPTPKAVNSLVDVRDLAAIHVALFGPGGQPPRILCGGHRVTMRELAGHLQTLTGRRFRVLPTPPGVLRGAGRLADVLASRLGKELAISEESMTLITQWPRTEDNVAEVGITYRPISETLEAAVHAWFHAGLITSRQAGALANPSNYAQRQGAL